MSALQLASKIIHKPNAIIVVSDTHFGSEDCSPGAFLNFLNWLDRWQSRKVKPKTSQAADLEPPELLILLGDILELEAPRHEDLTVPLRDTLAVFNKLFDLRCKKVYVTGNHDEEMSRYSSRRAERTSAGIPACNQWDYTCANQSAFVIASKHYPNVPEYEEHEWIAVGNDSYLFLHGHQFDKLFNYAADLKFIPAAMARLADLWSGVHPQLGGISFGLLFASFLVWSANRFVVIHFPAFVSALAALLTWLIPLWFIVLAIVGIPWIWVHLQRPVWKRISKYAVSKPKDKDIKTIIEEHYFDPRKFKNLNAGAIVFGHTHVPDCHTHYFGPDESTHPKSIGEKLRALSEPKREPFVGTMRFINSGAWGSPTAEASKAARNTVAYIDATRALLFQWDDELGTLKEFDVRPTVE